jgi:hypothetical protein
VSVDCFKSEVGREDEGVDVLVRLHDCLFFSSIWNYDSLSLVKVTSMRSTCGRLGNRSLVGLTFYASPRCTP